MMDALGNITNKYNENVKDFTLPSSEGVDLLRMLEDIEILLSYY